ncbi:MAG: HAD-IB family hydrolase [Actinomycetota bacterium]|nr:HAD-IB family hydrolase [Actinomycetota bacterium]
MSGPTVAAFDFDGTLSRRDTFLPFLQRLCGAQRLYGALARSMAVGRAGRDAVKDGLLLRLLAGRDAAEVDQAGAEYAAFLAGSSRLRPDTLSRAEEHRGRGHLLVIVSASPEVYLAPLGEQLGFDAVMATRLEVADDRRLTGRMTGPNCRGPEKVARLEEWLAARLGPGGERPHVFAYGDSAGDRELLARADVATRVRPRQALRDLSA